MLISHPNKSLTEHLNNTCRLGALIFKQKNISFEGYDYNKLKLLNRLILITHDIGKATQYFQEYITDIQNKEQCIRHKDTDVKDHGLLSGVFTFIIVNNILDDEILAFIAFILVSRHHNSLDNLMEYFGNIHADKNKSLLLKQFESIDITELQRVFNELELEFDLKNYDISKFKQDIEQINDRKFRNKVKQSVTNTETFLLINLLFSILIFSDKLEAIFHSHEVDFDMYLKSINDRPNIDSELVEEYKKTLPCNNKAFAQTREDIYQDVIGNVKALDLNSKILSINLPTGERVIIVTGCINALRSRVSGTLVNMIHALLRVIKYNYCKQCMRSKDVLALQY